jgi:hypothetical protein
MMLVLNGETFPDKAVNRLFCASELFIHPYLYRHAYIVSNQAKLVETKGGLAFGSGKENRGGNAL